MTITVYDRLKDEYALGTGPRGTGTDVLIAKRRGEAPPPKALDGLKPRKPSPAEGLVAFTPEQILTLGINEMSVNGAVRGYQRPFNAMDARKKARAMLDGKPFPPITVAVNGRGQCEIVDGQHRAGAAVLARLPIKAVVERMDAETRQALFTGQRFAQKIDPIVIVLSDTGPFERYVQEATAKQSGHPWAQMVAPSRSAKTRINPYALYQLLLRYVGNVEGKLGRAILDDRWDRGLADELAPLISCFGNKQTHPLAFRPWTLNAIGGTAMWVFRRHPHWSEPEHRVDGRQRWQSHMPQFPFDHWLQLRTQREMTEMLLVHWNKRLSGKRRVVRD